MPQKQSRAGRALEAMEKPNTVKSDILQSLIAPGAASIISVNDLLPIIASKCGKEAAKAFQALVLRKVTPEDMDKEAKRLLIEFCRSRKDILSKATLSQLEQ